MTSRNANLVVGTWNTHVGLALANGGFEWLTARAPRVRLWMLQEVPSRVLLRRHVGDAWQIIPGGDGHDRRGALPYVLAHRDRFDVRWDDCEAENITYGENHERARVAAALVDQVTGRDVWASSVHVAPLGRGFVDADPFARARHERQVQAYVDAAAARPRAAVVVDAGDLNERMGARLPVQLRDQSAVGRYAAAGIIPAHQVLDGDVGLDDVFLRRGPHAHFKARRELTVPVRGAEPFHPAVVVRLGINRIR